jgi:hypothetical protein
LGFDFGLQLNLDHRFYPPSSGNTTFREYDFTDPPPLFYSLRTVMGWMLNRRVCDTKVETCGNPKRSG